MKVTITVRNARLRQMLESDDVTAQMLALFAAACTHYRLSPDDDQTQDAIASLLAASMDITGETTIVKETDEGMFVVLMIPPSRIELLKKVLLEIMKPEGGIQ